MISIISFHMERISSMHTKNLNTWKWSMFLQKSTIRQSANWTFFCCESYGETKFILNLQIINFFNIIILNRNKTYINIKVQASLLIFSCKKIAGILGWVWFSFLKKCIMKKCIMKKCFFKKLSVW